MRFAAPSLACTRRWLLSIMHQREQPSTQPHTDESSETQADRCITRKRKRVASTPYFFINKREGIAPTGIYILIYIYLYLYLIYYLLFLFFFFSNTKETKFLPLIILLQPNLTLIRSSLLAPASCSYRIRSFSFFILLGRSL